MTSDEESIKKEIEEHFSYKVNEYVPNKTRFIWLVRRNMMEPLYFPHTGRFPVGLVPELVEFLNKNAYEFKIKGDFGAANFSEIEALEFIKTLNLPSKFVVRDYQLKYFVKCVRNKRLICLSPTNSGKSLLIYLVFRYFNQKTIISVPSNGLVLQLYGDFKEYGYDNDENIHLSVDGSPKNVDKLLTISTWQSLTNLPESYFENVKMVVGDEVHTNGADSLQKIMSKMPNASIRIGTTGSMPTDRLAVQKIKGAFGPIVKFVTTDDLIKQGFSSELVIKTIMLDHKLEMDEPLDYEDEIAYLITSERRNNFLINLALSLQEKGNTFLMFRHREQGQILYKALKKKSKVPVYYVDGTVPVKDREILRQTIEKTENSISVTSDVFATGINISSISNIVFCRPTKSQTKILQSIGRGLRKSSKKKHLTVIDICDLLCDQYVNVTQKHFDARLKIYKNEKFVVKPYKVNL